MSKTKLVLLLVLYRLDRAPKIMTMEYSDL